MIEALVYAYLLVGCGVGLVIWYSSFDKDFDQFVRDFYREEPPTKAQKIVTVLTSPVFWPYFIWKAFR